MPADSRRVDDQLEQLRQRIIRTITRNVVVAFVLAFGVVHGVRFVRAGDISVGGLIARDALFPSVLLAQLLVAAWVGLSFLMNPLGGRYLRVLARSTLHLCPTDPPVDDQSRLKALGLPGLRAITTLTDRAATAEVGEASGWDVYQSADSKVTVVLDGDNLMALSRLDDGRILYSSDLMVVPCSQVVVNLKPGASAIEVMMSHLRLSTKLAGIDRTIVPESAQIAVELLALERRSLKAIGPVAAAFLGLHGSAGPHRLLVAPTREELLTMGLRYKHSSSEIPREQSRVVSTDLSSNDMMVSSASS